jgi:hypothetical protein
MVGREDVVEEALVVVQHLVGAAEHGGHGAEMGHF